MFADDLQLYIHCRVSEINLAISKINEDLQSLNTWCEKHNLVLNPEKSQVLIIGKKSQTDIIEYNLMNKVAIKGIFLKFLEHT